jgi:two-component system response regulator FlrC
MSDSKPLILIIDDDPQNTAPIIGALSRSGYAARAATDLNLARRHISQEHPALVLISHFCGDSGKLDALTQVRKLLPNVPMIYMADQAAVELAVEAMRAGASDFIARPVVKDYLLDIIKRHITTQNNHGFIAEAESSQQLLTLARKVADSDVSVLVSGESGTGKEVLARYIHQQSSRRTAPFVAINCAAIPENMLEATLFGHEKGAFTGAYEARAGKFEQANGGTLLLDEISEMDLGLQAKILRVLQEKEVERVGGKKLIALDVRVLATTNRDLAQEVKEGRFREDLYYRLNVFPLHLLPLRERKEDILPITEHLLKRYAKFHVHFNDQAMLKLLEYEWPGNVRELENVLQRALIMSEQNQLTNEDVHFQTPTTQSPVKDSREEEQRLEDKVKHRETDLIIDALKASKGSRKQAAEQLGISPRTLRYKLARMRDAGISIPA